MIDTLERLVRAERGGKPSFTLYHIHILLRSLKKEPLGRPSIARYLSLSDSSTKTLLSRLEREGLIERSRSGALLTRRGLETLEWLDSMVRVCEANLDIESWRHVAVIIVKCVNPPVNEVSALTIRDYIVSTGCPRAIVGSIRGGEIRFPGIPRELETLIYEKISACLKEAENSLVVVIDYDKLARGYNAITSLIKSCV